ncbi:hypothetical protein WAB17_12520 [Parerythrobacter aurantius]|uniref:hypothetical protein n=1 Tax=Parerythrobacter aurantius TaxID=3127706 RepID=UPI0032498157
MKYILSIIAACALLSCSQSEDENGPAIKRGSDEIADTTSKQKMSDSTRYLIFEFPDGVRGGVGRFRGEASESSGPRREVTALLESCGAVEPQFLAVWSHSTHVVTHSTQNDRAVVECFLKATSRHFNVGTGNDPSLHTSKIDRSDFEDLENNPDRKRLD